MIGVCAAWSSSFPGPTRPVAEIDLVGLAEALGDASGETSWWYDPASGQVEMGVSEWFVEDVDDDDDPAERGLVRIESQGSHEAYLDMEAFASAVGDARAASLLGRALEGRGAFRRFRDTLAEFPSLGEHWLSFARAGAESRAIEWLLDGGYVTRDDAAPERTARAAIAASVAVAVGRSAGPQIDVAAVTGRWDDIVAAVDAGQTVTLRRDGTIWALITPP